MSYVGIQLEELIALHFRLNNQTLNHRESGTTYPTLVCVQFFFVGLSSPVSVH
jgi:hypothetical protein